MKRGIPRVMAASILLVTLSVLSPALARSGSPPLHAAASALAAASTEPHMPKGDPHAAAFAESRYPSATVCATCHPTQYDEWRFSAHAYASISPMFHKFEQAISNLSQGTVGYFCMRCHANVSTSLGETREKPLWERAQVSREGVTCVTCHRVDEAYSKANGERRIVPGDIHAPVLGGVDGNGVKTVVEHKKDWNVATAPGDFGLQMHTQGIRFVQLTQSEFCVSCHQVAVHPGIKLETVWDEYRASPAVAKGIRCQDCHMSDVPGQNTGYRTGAAAVINGRAVNTNRQHFNHAMVGPGYPIAHPGIFPLNLNSERFSVKTWLTFDYRAGWGTDAFENRVAKGEIKPTFPAEWAAADDRAEARVIVDSNIKKINEKKELRRVLMESGSHIDGPYFSGEPHQGHSLHFRYRVTNLNSGHNLPSGSLGAQPEVWLDVALLDPSGKNVWESGYVDSNGDMADLQSLDVHAGKIPRDMQLFNLQSKFLTTNVVGTDREMYLPVPFDGDQLPFIRPGETPTSVVNHPPFIRMEKRSLPPLASRDAKYTVPAELLKQPGKYRLAVRLRSRAEPIYFMRFVGATSDMEQAMNEWMVDIHPYTVEFQVR